ncbi:unnamed protein product [Caenorhabditis auriculariae]|uniref:HP domain-containing protein n=1 Tax=Caenorhabditis auriculariae TaxID=2777116 RepID=A0A8S1HIF3_9PELO|nr:unnamed protein product [Caenorhabditis auriculariae]
MFSNNKVKSGIVQENEDPRRQKNELFKENRRENKSADAEEVIGRESSILNSQLIELPIISSSNKNPSSVALKPTNIALGLENFFKCSEAPSYSPDHMDGDIDLDSIFPCSSNVLPRLPTPFCKTNHSKRNTPNSRISQDDLFESQSKYVKSKYSENNNVVEELNFARSALKTKQIECPFPEVMVIQFRGSKKVDVRLVAPFLNSINDHGCFVIVTRNELYQYEGDKSNILERNTAVRFCTSIVSKSELFCYAKKATIVTGDPLNSILVSALEPGEDFPERFQSVDGFENVASECNVVYRVVGGAQVEVLLYGRRLSISLLNPDEVFVFDFGSEIYVWTGKNSRNQDKLTATDFSRQLLGKNVSNARLVFGVPDNQRPKWALSRRVYQNAQDPLFTFKFDDWKENVSKKCIPVKASPSRKIFEKRAIVKDSPEELATRMLAEEPSAPVLTLENHEFKRDLKDVVTEDVSLWHLVDENLEPIDFSNVFYSTKCYVLRWKYRIQVSGVRRMKTGEVEERTTGRTRIAFFYWLGSRTTPKQHGLCALRIRDIDKDKSPHIRVEQGNEHSVFLALFNGSFVTKFNDEPKARFVLLGGTQTEAFLSQVEHEEPLRSHAVYLDLSSHVSGIAGSKCSAAHIRFLLTFIDTHGKFFGINNLSEVEINVEGDDKKLKWIDSEGRKKAPSFYRIFENDFEQLHHPHTHNDCAFTFSQNSLRDCVLVDIGGALWLWSEQPATTFALKVAQKYWAGRRGPSFLVQKGDEPNGFKALFVHWQDWEENVQNNSSSPKSLSSVLADRLRTFNVKELRERKELPEGMDLRRLEEYLSEDDFFKVFHMDREEFFSLPQWKQIELRKQVGLF